MESGFITMSCFTSLDLSPALVKLTSISSSESLSSSSAASTKLETFFFSFSFSFWRYSSNSAPVNLILLLTSRGITLSLSPWWAINCRAKVPGEEREVKITEFFGFVHHWRKSSLANPHSISGMEARTTFGAGTLFTSAMLWHSFKCLSETDGHIQDSLLKTRNPNWWEVLHLSESD